MLARRGGEAAGVEDLNESADAGEILGHVASRLRSKAATSAISSPKPRSWCWAIAAPFSADAAVALPTAPCGVEVTRQPAGMDAAVGAQLLRRCVPTFGRGREGRELVGANDLRPVVHHQRGLDGTAVDAVALLALVEESPRAIRSVATTRSPPACAKRTRSSVTSSSATGPLPPWLEMTISRRPPAAWKVAATSVQARTQRVGGMGEDAGRAGVLERIVRSSAAAG